MTRPTMVRRLDPELLVLVLMVPRSGSAIKKKDRERDRGATAAEKLSIRPAKAAIPEPQELREEGAILVLENNTYVVRAATPEKLVETLTSESRAGAFHNLPLG